MKNDLLKILRKPNKPLMASVTFDQKNFSPKQGKIKIHAKKDKNGDATVLEVRGKSGKMKMG